MEIIHELEKDFLILSLDLPGHGNSSLENDPLSAIHSLLQNFRINICALIGYSLGGRLVLQLKQKYPHLYTKTIVMSAHLGLATGKEEQWKKDLAWADLLEKISLREFLELWYKQPLFSSLDQKEELRSALIEKRADQNPSYLAAILKSCSLAKQPMFTSFTSDVHFLYGEEDLKYANLYKTHVKCENSHVIQHAGHMVHLENPHDCAMTLRKILL